MTIYIEESDFVDKRGWTRWIYPRKRGYKMACCDCALVHMMNFRIVKRSNGTNAIEFQVKRDNRATGAFRRWRNKL